MAGFKKTAIDGEEEDAKKSCALQVSKEIHVLLLKS